MTPANPLGPLWVGLTGNFGTGKSTVAKFFKKKGARVIEADRLVHEIFRKKHRLYPRVRSIFPEIRGELRRAKVAEIIFRNPKKRRALEALAHPYVFHRIWEKLRRGGAGIVILEVPLLFESGFHKRCVRTIVVKAPEREVLQRLSRQGFERPDIEARWRAQMPLQEKIRRSDYRIDNSDGLRKTRRQVDRIWKELKVLEAVHKGCHGESRVSRCRPKGRKTEAWRKPWSGRKDL